jgi:hypothetical protein
MRAEPFIHLLTRRLQMVLASQVNILATYSVNMDGPNGYGQLFGCTVNYTVASARSRLKERVLMRRADYSSIEAREFCT